MPRRLLLLIFILTLTDALCTAAGLRLGVITEANPVLRGMMSSSPVLAPAGLVVFTGVLLLFLYAVRGRVRWLGGALRAVAAVKLVVLGMHFAWMAQIA